MLHNGSIHQGFIKTAINAGYRLLYGVRVSSAGKTFGAALTVAILTLGLSIASIGKEVVVAASFGVGDVVDAFLIAFLPLSFVISVVTGSFTYALLPTYVQVREQQGEEAAQELFSQVVAIAFVLLSVVAAVFVLLSPYLLPFLCVGFDAEKLALTQRLFYFLLPVIIIKGLATVWSAILNAGEHFGLVAAAPITVPVSSIIALYIWRSAFGVHALVIGTIVGFLLELLLLGWGLKWYKNPLILRWPGNSPALRQVIGQYLPMVAGMALLGGSTFVDTAMAAALNPGSVAALNYGSKMVVGILGIGVGSLGTVVLPFFSKLVSIGDWTTLRHILKTYSLLILLVTIPLTLLLFVFSESLVRLIFERGKFNETDTQLVGQIQAVYVLQIPFYVLSGLFSRFLCSITANHILMFGSFLNFLLNIVLNYILMQYLGIVGIALATVCVSIFACGFLLIMSSKTLAR